MVMTSSDESNVVLPPPKKRWSCDVSQTGLEGATAAVQKGKGVKRSGGRGRRGVGWRLGQETDDPVEAPTASEMEAARTLLKLTPRNTRRRWRAVHNDILGVRRPEGVPPLYGTLKQVEANRNHTNEKSKDLRSASEGVCSRGRSMMERSVVAGGSSALTTSGVSLLHPPCSVLPSVLQQSSGRMLTEGTFDQNLDVLHDAAGQMTVLMRSGHVPLSVVNHFTSTVPPVVFQPEFLQEIEQVRSNKKKRVMPGSAPFPLFKKKPSKT